MENDHHHPNNSKKSNLVHQKTWTDYLWIIREHWILALLIATCLAGYYAYRQFQTIPLYRSVAILLFEPKEDRVINIESVVDSSIGGSAEIILRNHLTDLRSNSFRGRVVGSFSTEEKELIVNDYGGPEDNIDASVHRVIAGANKIALVGGNVFKFEFHHRNPQAAALLANRFSEEFLDFILERTRKTNEAALRFLRSQSEELKLKVERSELAVQQYRQERNLVSLEESQNLIVERMKSLSTALNTARVQLLNLSSGLEQIEQAKGDFEALASLPSVNQMGSLPQKLEERLTLMAQRKSLSLRYGRRHPRMIENETQLETLETEIQNALGKNVSDMKQQFRAAQSRVANLEEALAEAEQDSLELDQIAIEYNVLRRKLETDKRLFTQVHSRLNEAILASQLSDTNMRLVDRAWPAGDPFTPDTAKIYSTSIFIFLALFSAVPFGIHYLNLNLKTASDIEEQLHIPFLGEVKKFPKRIKNLHRIILDKVNKEGTETFRQLHSQILLKVGKLKPGHTFLITSALPKEGKSFLATNLAASFSKHHYRTLLVDCDFRRPTVGPVLLKDIDKDPEKLQGQAKKPIHVEGNLYVLPFGDSMQEATEHIESNEFRESLKAFKTEYDILIIDTPPSALFPDASLIGKYADDLIFLTQLNKHRKSTLKAILNRLDQSDVNILGIVVNKVTRGNARNLGAYRYGKYNKYKSYYSTEVKV